MGFLERIEKARGRRERGNPVTAADMVMSDSRYGHDDSLFSTDDHANLIATSNEVYAAAQLRARLMSSLNLELFRGRGVSKRRADNSRPAQVLQHVNPFWTPRRLARMDELSMCLWGETFWAIEPGADGQPANIWWLKPSRVRPVVHSAGYISGFVYQPAGGGPPITFRANEIVWFRYPNPLDEFSSLSPAGAARLAAETGQEMMKSNRALFRNGLALGGLIVPETDKVTFSSEQARELERDLERRWTGAERKHRWAVLRFEAQFRAMDVTPKDAEFVSGLDLTLRQVCNAYGIPAPLLNDLAHATLANTREFERILWQNTLVPDARLKSDELQEQFLPLFRDRVDGAEYDFTQVEALQEAATAVWGREAQAMDRGAITINEWREAKGMPPVAWGYGPWMAVNKARVDPDTGELVLPAGAADEEPGAEGAQGDEGEVDPAAKAEMVDPRGRYHLLNALDDQDEEPRRARPVF